jgi:hypothetical protein
VIAELLIQAEVAKIEALGEAMKGIGENVRIVQFSGSDGNLGSKENALVELLKGIPELATIVNAKTEALTGDNLEVFLKKLRAVLTGSRINSEEPELADASEKDKTAQPTTERDHTSETE